MKIKNLLYLLSIVFLLSCSDDNYITTNDTDSIMNPSLRAQENNHYKELGWGIDMTGDYLSMTATKAPIIDVLKFEKDFEDRIISKEHNAYSYSKVAYGYNTEEYVKNRSLDFSEKFTVDSAFSGTITSNFASKNAYSANYSFASMDQIISFGQAYFVEKSPAVLQKYLSDGFLYSIKNKNAKTIVQEYGTHVLLDIEIGGKLSFLYRCEVNGSSKEASTKAGFTVDVLSKFGFSISGAGSSSLVKNNSKTYTVIRSSGGIPSISYSWDISQKGPIPNNMNYSNWSNSINYNNSVTVQINNIIPIYDLISDPSKREEVKKEVNNYIASRAIQMLIPMHRYWAPKGEDHFYTKERNDAAHAPYVYEGIEFYGVKEQLPGTVPLYRYWSQKLFDHMYKTEMDTNPIYTLEGVECYVYKNKTTETVPIHCYWSNKISDHMYKVLPDDNKFYMYEGDLFYAYPGDNK